MSIHIFFCLSTDMEHEIGCVNVSLKQGRDLLCRGNDPKFQFMLCWNDGLWNQSVIGSQSIILYYAINNSLRSKLTGRLLLHFLNGALLTFAKLGTNDGSDSLHTLTDNRNIHRYDLLALSCRSSQFLLFFIFHLLFLRKIKFIQWQVKWIAFFQLLEMLVNGRWPFLLINRRRFVIVDYLH